MLRITGVPKFEADLKKFAKRIDVGVEQIVRSIALDMFKGVITRTPVDTGWARASWNIAFTEPDWTPGPKITGGEEVAAAVNKVEEAKLKKGALNFKFPKVWITNGLPYIIPLENGHSKQTGRGYMVQRTMSDIVANVNKNIQDAIKEINKP
jgi:uncharacterized protein CbrC (UPF0167 family)